MPGKIAEGLLWQKAGCAGEPAKGPHGKCSGKFYGHAKWKDMRSQMRTRRILPWDFLSLVRGESLTTTKSEPSIAVEVLSGGWRTYAEN